ncbi:MAG: S8 family serine peptidase [Actinobacteria bacterium]|nr:S8 family serine peptidase [Actinomycetota bacterium]
MRRPRRVAALLLCGCAVVGAGYVDVAGALPGGHPPDGRRDRTASGPTLHDPTVPGLDASLRGVAGLRTPTNRLGRMVGPNRDRLGNVAVYVDGSPAAVDAALARVGGQVALRVPGRTQAVVPTGRLVALARSSGVLAVRSPTGTVDSTADTSEGVAAAAADVWQHAQGDGSGVKVGIVDAGFAGLDAAQARGALPAQLAVNDLCEDTPDSGTGQLNSTRHGTAVAEIVHAMAPGAELYLACVHNTVQFAEAARWMATQGVRVVNASVTFPVAGRGDGSGDLTTPDGVLRASRQAGLLWSVSAGNTATTHWRGTVEDPNRDRWVQISGGYELEPFWVPAGGTASVALQWDAWPKSNGDLDLVVMDSPVLTSDPTNPRIVGYSARNQAGTPGGLDPTEYVQFTNTSGAGRYFYAALYSYNPPGSVRYDLTFYGQVGYVAFRDAAGSIGEPADSPYALAVGAVSVSTNAVESYSSRGPTIDGRTKPDIGGYDGVSTVTYGNRGFFGTSAAAPHVAGAAALLAAADPALDAAQIEAELLRRAVPVPGAGANDLGRGRLSLAPGTVPTSTAPGLRFTPLAAPVRLLDTRTRTGGHLGALGPGEEFAVAVRGVGGVPADAAAVVLNLTGVGATGCTYLSVYPRSYPGTSNLNLCGPAPAAGLVTTALGSDGRVRVRNASLRAHVLVTVAGSFSSGGAAGYVPGVAPVPVLDTRSAVGGHRRPLGPGEEVAVAVRGVAGVPGNATAVVVNLLGSDPTTPTYLSVYPQRDPGTSNLNLTTGTARANLVVTGIGPDGRIRVRNGAGRVGVTADVVGWFVPGAGARFVPLSRLTRIMDTRVGLGSALGQLTGGQTATMQAGGLFAVPYTATAVALNVTGVAPSRATTVTIWPAGRGRPASTTLTVAAGQTVPNAVFGGIGQLGQLAVSNTSGGGIDLVADLAGYFVP